MPLFVCVCVFCPQLAERKCNDDFKKYSLIYHQPFSLSLFIFFKWQGELYLVEAARNAIVIRPQPQCNN